MRDFIAYHQAHGGISRYQKFEWLIAYLGLEDDRERLLPEFLQQYAQAVRDGLLQCDVAAHLYDLRAYTSNARWLIVSGGQQDELRDIFKARGIDALFDGGIWGSPDTKDTLVKRQIDAGNIEHPAIFLGDSRYDHEVAARFGFDFVFVSGWTEFSDWQAYCADRQVHNISYLSAMITSAA